MTKIDLTLDLPDRVARDARNAGLLSAGAVARLLREEIRRQAAGRLASGAERAAEAHLGRLSDQELEDEIAAVRKNRRPAAG